MTTREQLTKTLEEAQNLLRELIQGGAGRRDALNQQIDALQDVAMHVEYELKKVKNKTHK